MLNHKVQYAHNEQYRAKLIALLVLWALASLICSDGHAEVPSLGAGTYNVPEARKVVHAVAGRVLSVRTVSIDVPASQASQVTGTAIGGLVGGAVGYKVSKGNYLASTLGAIVGGLTGDVVTRKTVAEQRRALEVLVQLKNGQVIAVTQEMDSFGPQVGQQVMVLMGENARVVPVPTT